MRLLVVLVAALVSHSLAAQSLLVDLAPGVGANPGSIVDRPFARMGALVYFVATDHIGGTELWRTDGTTTGTQLVADVVPGTTSSDPSDLTVLGSTLYFVATHPRFGRELWRTDGTAAGTVCLDVIVGTTSSEPHDLVEYQGFLYFVAGYDGQLRKTNGTTVATVNQTLQSVSSLVVAHGDLWVLANVNSTRHLVRVYPDDTRYVYLPTLLSPVVVRATATHVYVYSALTTAHSQLQVVSATQTSPLMIDLGAVATVAPFDDSVLGSSLLLKDENSLVGSEPFVVDGTVRLPLADIWPGSSGSRPSRFLKHGSEVFFSAEDGSHGRELWITDGTATGTRMVADLAPGSLSSWPVPLASSTDGVYFNALTWPHGREPWKTDGTAAGTGMIRDLTPGIASTIFGPIIGGGVGVFASCDEGTRGHELWTFGPGPLQASLVRDIGRSPISSRPRQIVSTSTLARFVADSPARSQHMTDGIVTTVPQGSFEENALTPTPVRHGFATYWTAGTLWNTEGSASLTQPGWSSAPTTPASFGPYLAFVGSGLVFYDGVSGYTNINVPGGVRHVLSAGPLFILTNGGTYVMDHPASAPVYAGANFDIPVASLGNLGLFNQGPTLFACDGTPFGAVALGPSAVEAVVFGNRVIYHAQADGELWVTDGTAVGTSRLKDVFPGPSSAYPTQLTVSAPHVYFIANDGVAGRELHVTDGTTAGTRLVIDLWPGIQDGIVAESELQGRRSLLGLGDGRVVFTGNEGHTGTEAWVSDGSAAGTTQVFDLLAGPHGSLPADFAIVGDRILFAADSLELGRELFWMPAALVGASHVAYYGHACVGSGGRYPTIAFTGSSRIGGSFHIALREGPPIAPVFQLLSLSKQFGSLAAGCMQYVSGDFVTHFAVSDVSGAARITFPIPQSPTLVGWLVHAQWAALDPVGPVYGFATTSDAVQILIGN